MWTGNFATKYGWRSGLPQVQCLSNFRPNIRQWPERSGVAYAVIEARWCEAPADRFAIAYREEESLRDLFAAQSIISVGFRSREEAEGSIKGQCSEELLSQGVLANMALKCDEIFV
jgi:hypothetical protein